MQLANIGWEQGTNELYLQARLSADMHGITTLLAPCLTPSE